MTRPAFHPPGLTPWAPVAITLVSLIVLGLATCLQPHPVLINESPSLPRGLYLRDPRGEASVGAIVAFAQPAAVRPYLSGLGMPEEVRLLKRVAAAGGDPVCETPDGVRVGSLRVPVLAADRRGLILPRWRGCRALERDERFVLGDTPGSFDSRYFGPVPDTAIEGVYRRIVTW